MIDFFRKILQLPRNQKRLITLAIDTLFIVLAFWCAFLVRTDIGYALNSMQLWSLLLAVLIVSLPIYIKLGLYRAVLRYISSRALGVVLLGVLLSTVSLVLLAFYLNITIPRSAPPLFACFSLLLVGGSRVLIRSFVGQLQNRRKEPIIIYGAGSAGRQLATAIHNSGEYQAVAFIDDDINKRGTTIQGVEVFHSKEIEYVIKSKLSGKILLALPTISRSRKKEIIITLEPLPIQVMSIPSIADLVNDQHKITEIKDVGVEDLLGRDPVAPVEQLMAANIENKVVMVTGAGGSIGSELCRQILLQNPKKLVLFELSEFALYSIEKELSQIKVDKNLDVEIFPLLGSVQRKNRLAAVFSSFSVQTVYHAAAYKHVPLVEHNVVEGVRNNIFGTLYTAQAAIDANVETFVLISTDKAVRPTNVMGTTKRMSELVLQALAKQKNNTRFCMVRFGNVLGSSGSVVPLFRKQIKTGGPVTLTHPEITRYFMTIPEAAQLVIQAGAMGEGGDVFVLDMGQPVKIIDLATKMIHLTGFDVKSEEHPLGDIEIKCTGLRPGEKLYEELLIGDNVSGTTHERIMTAQESYLSWDELVIIINQLDSACHNFEHQRIREILLSAPTGFNPTDGICDLVWMENKQVKSDSEIA